MQGGTATGLERKNQTPLVGSSGSRLQFCYEVSIFLLVKDDPIMNPIVLLQVTLRRRRQLVQVRQRCRQMAALLGLATVDQAAVSAAVFALACQVLERRQRVRVIFQVHGQFLEIHLSEEGTPLPGAEPPWHLPRVDSREENHSPDGPWRLTKKLPPQSLTADDLAWVVQQIGQQTDADLFAEIVRQNQEILQVVQELRDRERELAQFLTPQRGSTAA